MSAELLCRICLAYDVRMHSILNTDLQDVYEKLSGNMLQSEGKPVMACFICCRQLRTCHRLMQRASKADELLHQILASSEGISNLKISQQANKLTVNLSVSQVVVFMIPTSFDNIAKEETELREPSMDDIKQEAVEEESEQNDICGSEVDNISKESSDSEDNVPLKSISTKNKRATTRGRSRTTRNIKHRKALLIDAREITLTHEEQMRNLLKRAESLNYLNSPYKCDTCYKGFVEIKAYENHKDKHLESSGAFACAVCGMRYKTERLLRSHTNIAHSRLYQCNRCPHMAHTANQARIHEQWHNGHIYECQLCSQQFKKPTSYFTHMRKRHPTGHACGVCGECFGSHHGLLMHRTKAHRRGHVENSDEPAPDRFCPECNIQFASVVAWKRHIVSSITHTLAPHGSECRICGVCISGDVSAHMKQHEKDLCPRTPVPTVDKPVVQLTCEQCGANFPNRSKLHAHVKRVHLGVKYNKNIVCEVCGKKCTSNATLKYHQRTHTGERPHACPTCGKHFATTNLLRIHTRIHSGERPYCCSVCGKRFSQKPALNRHCRVHTGAKPYGCQYCPKSFSQSNSLKLHVGSVHLKLPPNVKKNKAQSSKNDVEEKSDGKNLTQNL